MISIKWNTYEIKYLLSYNSSLFPSLIFITVWEAGRVFAVYLAFMGGKPSQLWFMTSANNYCLQMMMKLKQIVGRCHPRWCVAHQVPVPVMCLMICHQVQRPPLQNKCVKCQQLHKHPFCSHPLPLQQIISCLSLTCQCGDVKKSAVAPYSEGLMVRSL